MNSYRRVCLAQDEGFQQRVLILAIDYAHDVMNIEPKSDNILRCQAKAVELLNQPESFKQRIAYSVVARLRSDLLDPAVDDESLVEILPDIFDALAGVTPQA